MSVDHRRSDGTAVGGTCFKIIRRIAMASSSSSSSDTALPLRTRPTLLRRRWRSMSSRSLRVESSAVEGRRDRSWSGDGGRLWDSRSLVWRQNNVKHVCPATQDLAKGY